MISHIRDRNFKFATGQTLFRKRNSPTPVRRIAKIIGLIIFIRERPDDFIAVNSKFSARVPKVIMDPSSTARGITIGTIVAEE